MRNALVGALGLLIGACGDGRTPLELGKSVSGTLTKDDSCWTSCNSPPPGQTPTCNGGCSDKYQVDVTAGTSYTVTFSSSTRAEVQFEDLENGHITDKSGGGGSTVGASHTPATWVPKKSGINRVGVYALTDYLPASYTLTVTKK